MRGRWIAYFAPVQPDNAWNDGLFVMAPDGSGPHLLDEHVSGVPSWSPDGRMLVYSRSADHNAGIYVVEVGTGKLTRLTSTDGWDGPAVWSPDGTRIAYVHDHDTLRVADLRTGMWRRAGSSSGRVMSVAWASDSQWLYFRGEDKTTREQYFDVITSKWYLYRVDMATGRQEKLWEHEGAEAVPSPDGRHLAVMLDREGGRRLHLAAVDGGRLESRPTEGLDAQAAHWSPRGSLLMVEVAPREDSSIGRKAGLLLVDISSGKMTLLVESGVEWGSPSWSPDGARIIYSRDDKIVVLEVASRKESELQRGKAPRWSP
jgi:Tol biopolymer transport system component